MAEVIARPMEVDKVDKLKDSAKISPELESLTFEDIREHCRSIERAENTKETRLINRVLRSLITTRRRINGNILWRLVNYYFVGPAASKQKTELVTYLKTFLTIEIAEQVAAAAPGQKSPRQQRKPAPGPTTTGVSASTSPSLLPEVETYIHLLIVLFLIQEARFQEAETCVGSLAKRLENQNKRSLDPLAAKVYYFYAVIAEKLGKLSDCALFFQNRLRVATLRHDEDSQATLINCLLRTYLNDRSYELAASLIPKAQFPLSSNTNEWARYHYYVGRIKATELLYAEAKQALQLALRKAPQHTGVGFKQSVQKLLVTVELLMGEIPERSIFRQSIYRKALAPYLQLAQAVRVGDIDRFDKSLKLFSVQLERDQTRDLAVRLKENVITTAVRQIALAYSQISLADVQKKLGLDHVDDAQYILAKAIKDGVIDAELNVEKGCMQTKECPDLYSTALPQLEYHKRIQFCLDIHNQAVKAMRFPPKSYAKDAETAEEKREREQQELEFAKEMADDDDDFS